jgi:hypothetical protein
MGGAVVPYRPRRSFSPNRTGQAARSGSSLYSRLRRAEVTLSSALAEAENAGFRVSAFDAAPSAVIAIRRGVDTYASAEHEGKDARIAHPCGAALRPVGADIATGAAVIDVRLHERADPVACDCSLHAGVDASTVETGGLLEGTGLIAKVAAGSAVIDVAGQVGAMAAATGRPGGAAGEGTRATTDAAGIAATRPARRNAGGPLGPGITTAERFARIAGSPNRTYAQRAEKSASQGGP